MSDKNKTLTLISSDEKKFVVEASIAFQSETIKDAARYSDSIFLQNVDGETLGKIIEYCTKHAEGGDLNKFDEEFVDVDRSTLHLLGAASDNLGIKTLLHRVCWKIANIIRDMNVEEMREFLGVENDYSPAHEEMIRREYPWVYDYY